MIGPLAAQSTGSRRVTSRFDLPELHRDTKTRKHVKPEEENFKLYTIFDREPVEFLKSVSNVMK